MKLLLVFLVVFAVFRKTYGADETCDASKCAIANNCRCSSIVGPLNLKETPQLIVLAFVDAAREDSYNNIWSPLVESRKNPDDEYISATFYIPHEYSDYQIVHDLATLGFEIGVHSVTKNSDQDYWRYANETLLEDEFGSQRKIIAKYANIPEANIVGTLTPQLQLAGDNSIKAFVAQGFIYDNSWSSKTSLYPYTLDYASTQICDTGANCPKEAHPGFWMAPIVDLTGEDKDVCATLAACFRKRYNQTSAEITDWLVGEINKVKTANRAPITLIVEENLFSLVKSSWEGLTKALDKIQEDKEVFFVSQARVIEWIKNPVPISEFKTSASIVNTGCVRSECVYKNGDGLNRYMISCVPCPKNYPWLGNPEGK